MDGALRITGEEATQVFRSQVMQGFESQDLESLSVSFKSLVALSLCLGQTASNKGEMTPIDSSK